MHETALAEQDFLRALKLAPNDADHTNNYGWFLCQNGREKQAMELFEKVIANPAYTSPSKPLVNAGMCSLKMKNDFLAEKYFSQALRVDPGNVSANLNLATIYYQSRDWQRAQYYVNRLVKADNVTAGTLWLGIKIAHKLQDVMGEESLAVQLRRRHPDSDEFALLERGAFDE